MAQSGSNPAPATTTKSTDDLAKQVDALKADIAALTDTITKLGKEKATSAKEEVELRAQLLKQQGVDAANSAQDELTRLTGEAERAVRERPGAALAIAAGIGLVIGLLSGRK
ncbi:glycine zipper domain-containing protein [Roseobacter sp. HKCCA0434]|uniref:glycine zipper domain-containing protein n=1 Tax=Roseobacter sp. HKCCA0434 TaxID=3079297 RepID=UPI002905CF55|nr:DUF883 domain-containing protein [Roseobacter sp. HKCCA0434]